MKYNTGADRSGVRTSLGDKKFYLFLTCPGRSWGPPNFLYNGYRGPSPGGNAAGEGALTTHPNHTPKLRMSGAVTSIPTSVPPFACHGVNCAFKQECSIKPRRLDLREFKFVIYSSKFCSKWYNLDHNVCVANFTLFFLFKTAKHTADIQVRSLLLAGFSD